ncbi:DUF177 domain-containing protein [Rhodococcus sp. X156]|uniref:YceD family protein n=1 Tax=Rhodococcus sp. X156 TaxID=2499145 RepID=UPI000FDB72B5|nr:DUF177 domain-containing protein [Rhodococcus sp. X156]
MPAHSHSGTHVDPSAPLVLDTRELGRRPGSMRTVERTVDAPERIGLELIAVPQGDPLELDLRLESVMEGVLVSGTVTASAVGECSRCLETFTRPVQITLTELYYYPAKTPQQAEEDDEARMVEDELIDLAPAVTEAIVLDLPLQPLCSEDCPGLCAQCGVQLAIAEPGHGHETIDPRWAALSAKLDQAGVPEPSAKHSTDDGAPTDLEEK